MYSRIFIIPKPPDWGFAGESCHRVYREYGLDIHDAIYGVLNDMCQDESTVIESLVEAVMDAVDLRNMYSYNETYRYVSMLAQHLVKTALVYLSPYMFLIQMEYRPIAVESFLLHGLDGYALQLLVVNKQ